MVTPPQITALAPIHTSSSRVMGLEVEIPSRRCSGSRAWPAQARHTPGGNKGVGPDVHRGSVQYDAVVIDHGQAVGVDIEAIVAAEPGLDKGKGMTGAQQLLQNDPPLSLGPRWGLVIPPAQALGPFFQPGRNVPVLPHIALIHLQNI